jgi:hypothetical protein
VAPPGRRYPFATDPDDTKEIRVKNRFKLVLGVLLIALTLAACSSDDNGGGDTGGTTTGGTTTGATATTGGGETVSAAEYAKSVCTTMSTYVNDVTNLSNTFASGLDPSADLAGQRDAVVGFLDDVLTSTDKLITNLEAAGVPDVDNGQEIVDKIKASFAQAKSVIAEAKDKVQNLSLDDPTAFATQLSGIGTAIQDSMTGIGTSLQTLSSPELEQAVASEPACSSLSGGASGATGTS